MDNILVSQEFYDNSKNRIWSFKDQAVFNDYLNQEEHKSGGTTDRITKASFECRLAK